MTMRAALVGAVVALFALSGTAFAAECKNPGPAKVLKFDTSDTDTARGLYFALQFGLDPGTFPAADIAKQKTPCERGRIVLPLGSYVLRGDDDGLPPRWASDPGQPDRIAYIALMPRPAAALALRSAQPGTGSAQFGPDDMMYVLAVTDGSDRQLFRYYSTLPGDEQLKLDVCQALNGELPVIGRYNTNTLASDFELSAASHSGPECRALP